jgi:hypothetical protein
VFFSSLVDGANTREKVKLSNHHTTKGWGVLPQFLAKALDGDEWSASCPGRFTPGEKPPVPILYVAGWNQEPAVQPISHRYIDWAITAPAKAQVISLPVILPFSSVTSFPSQPSFMGADVFQEIEALLNRSVCQWS